MGSQLFEEASIELAGGKTFRVRAKNASDTYKYIGSARLNGRKLKRPFLPHADIMNGGMLELAMTDRPTR
ncbi:glycoside hydrolase domain-containing protein [Parapedobacter pyrenivorans]|uniref:glycoside hydrolase domain-containing protein n=1 Tax=Parapedobacter pyrenivorans TaxID=1305674 RepID=UPI00333F3C51